jgi:formylglycine-generating enzyme required for sulfatase activity
MAGNVWEWTLSEYGDYPYDPKDGREKLEGERARVLRGGSWGDPAGRARCSFRIWLAPGLRGWFIGFRVVASPFFALDSDSSEL